MKKILYLDCASGISGDMFAAALLDLKLCDGQQVLNELYDLHVDGFELEVSPTRSYGLAALNFDVKLEEHHHHHEHGHEEDSGHHHHHHEHRHLADIFAIFDRSGMSSGARELAKRIFTIVAEAEGKAHGLPVEQLNAIAWCDNTAVACLEFTGASVRLVYENDNSHLDKDVSTFEKQSWWRAETENPFE